MWHIILNPMARRGAAKSMWPEMEQILQELGIAYSVHFTTHRGHASRLADDIILKGGRHILGVGGDGTNSEIVHGILSQKWVASSEVHYALMPFGTGNDWARFYGIPTDIRQRLRRLQEQRVVFQDGGLVRYQSEGKTLERYFVNVAGMAYDGFIGQKMITKPAKNKIDYLLRVAMYLFEYRLTKARITYDGQVVEDYFYTINIGLGKYSGGGMQLVPQAVGNDGLFALTFARALPKWEVLAITPRFYDGSIIKHPKVTGVKAKSIKVEHMPSEKPTLLEADGEFLGETPVEYFLLENALKLVL